MKFKFPIFIIVVLFLSLLIRLFLINNHLHDPSFNFQQDNYADFARIIKDHSYINPDTNNDSRLFPGYSFLIIIFSYIFQSGLISGIFISVVSSLFAIYLLWALTKDRFTTLLFAFFPPIWVQQGAKVANEPITVLLFLAGVFCFLKKKYWLAGLISGIAFNIRLISICFIAGLIFYSLLKKNYKAVYQLLISFAIFSLPIFIFNYWFFGSKYIFQQFVHTQYYGSVNFGIVQLLQDIARTIDWKQYRILISGLFYLAINIFALFTLFRFRNKSELIGIFFYWMLFSFIFVMILSPFTFIENFARYAIPFTPALIFGLLLNIKYSKKIKNKFNSLVRFKF